MANLVELYKQAKSKEELRALQQIASRGGRTGEQKEEAMQQVLSRGVRQEEEREIEVRAGDNVFKIAEQVYGNQRMAGPIMAANNNVTVLHPGMKLKLPAPQVNPYFSNSMAERVGISPAGQSVFSQVANTPALGMTSLINQTTTDTTNRTTGTEPSLLGQGTSNYVQGGQRRGGTPLQGFQQNTDAPLQPGSPSPPYQFPTIGEAVRGVASEIPDLFTRGQRLSGARLGNEISTAVRNIPNAIQGQETEPLFTSTVQSDRSLDAYSQMMTGIADRQEELERQRGPSASGQRYTDIAQKYAQRAEVERGLAADAARWNAIGSTYPEAYNDKVVANMSRFAQETVSLRDQFRTLEQAKAQVTSQVKAKGSVLQRRAIPESLGKEYIPYIVDFDYDKFNKHLEITGGMTIDIIENMKSGVYGNINPKYPGVVSDAPDYNNYRGRGSLSYPLSYGYSSYGGGGSYGGYSSGSGGGNGYQRPNYARKFGLINWRI